MHETISENSDSVSISTTKKSSRIMKDYFLSAPPWAIKVGTAELLWTNVKNANRFEDFSLVIWVLMSWLLNMTEGAMDAWQFSRMADQVMGKMLWFSKGVEQQMPQTTATIKHINSYKLALEFWQRKSEWKWWNNIDSSNPILDLTVHEYRDLLSIIWENLTWNELRFSSVVHWYWAKWKARKIDTHAMRVKNSNFIFPPAEKLDEILWKMITDLHQNKDDPFLCAAILYTYTFIAHPFKDWNSRTARIVAVSYLESLGYSRFRLFTAIREILWEGHDYLSTLRDLVYGKIRYILYQFDSEWNKVWSYKIHSDGDIEDYSMDALFWLIIPELRDRMRDTFVQTNLYIMRNLNRIYEFFWFIIWLYTDMGIDDAIIQEIKQKFFAAFQDKEIDFQEDISNSLKNILLSSRLSKSVLKRIRNKSPAIYYKATDEKIMDDYTKAVEALIGYMRDITKK